MSDVSKTARRTRPLERRSRRRSFAILVMILSCGLLSLPAPALAEIEVRLNRVDSYIPRFPIKRTMNRAYRPQLDALQTEMHKRMVAGENLSCSAQIFEEAHWLINFTDRQQDVERRIADLRESLKTKDQVFATGQDPKDGSFGACFEEWLWRFNSSVDPLKELARQGKRPEVPLAIWAPVDTPDEIQALIRDLIVSEAKGRHNKRKELNAAITALGQLLWLDYTAVVFPEHLDRKALGDALKQVVDEEWQDPQTGYWGAWYREDGVIKKTNDLSITFHIVSYRDGAVQHMGEIARTTLGLRHVKYPYGWDTGGTQNNHHAYDVVRIINMAWHSMDATARSHAAAAIFLMGARSLAMSIDHDGVFDPRPFTTVAEAYYFGISFFEEIGLFGNKVPINLGVTVTNTEPLLAQIDRNLATLHPADPWVAAARRKLEGLKQAHEVAQRAL